MLPEVKLKITFNGCWEIVSQGATQFEASLMSVAHLLTSLTLNESHSIRNACLHYYHAPLWDKALQPLFSLSILSRSKRSMLHLLGSLIGRRVKVQRVDETDRNPITPGVTQFHWTALIITNTTVGGASPPQPQKSCGCLVRFFITSSTHIVSLAFRKAWYDC